MKKSLIEVFVFVASLVLTTVLSAEEYHFLYEWGDVRLPMEFQLNIPRGVAVDSSGFVYVSDTYHGRVIKYDATGNIMWIQNYCDGAILYPMELIVGPDGGVYVPDLQGHRIVVLKASNGECVGSFGSYGSGPEQFNGPISVAFDVGGNLYVSDRYNHRISKFRWDGRRWINVAVIGPYVEGYGELGAIWGVAIDGNWLYVADEIKGKIVKLDLNGNFITAWGGNGTGNSQFHLAGGIDVDGQHRVYVADIEHHRIHRFSSDGVFEKIIGGRGTGEGRLQFPSDVAIDRRNGWLYVADNDNSRIQKLDLDGNFIYQWGTDAVGTTGLRYPTKLTIDHKNRVIYMVDSGNSRILKLTLALRKITEWGGFGDEPGKFEFPFDVDVDNDGNVYVIDNVQRKLQVFAPDGTFIRSWTIEGLNPVRFLYGAHAVDVYNNDVYIVDASTSRVYRFNTSGNFIASYTTDYYSTGFLTKNDSYFISTFSGNRVLKRNFDWMVEGEIGKGYLFHPYDVAIDRDGNIFVTDTFQNRFVKFAPDGTVKNSVGSGMITDPGVEPGQFHMPYGIDVDSDGFVYVADTDNHRLQKFTPDIYHVMDVPPAVCTGMSFRGGINFINWGSRDVAHIEAGLFVPDGFSVLGDSSKYLPVLYSGWKDSLYWTVTAPLKSDLYDLIIRSTYPYGASESITRVDVVDGPTFADVPCDYWAFGWIERFYKERVTAGCSVNPLKYCPDSVLTRAQMATFIVKLLYGENPVCANGILCKDTEPYFSDVFPDNIYYRYIQKMKETGITAGCGKDIYCPDRPITRAEMAVFIIKARRAVKYNKSVPSFNDVPSYHWAYSYIEALNRLGITSGCGGGRYCPDGLVTRAQMAVFLSKAFLNN